MLAPLDKCSEPPRIESAMARLDEPCHYDQTGLQTTNPEVVTDSLRRLEHPRRVVDDFSMSATKIERNDVIWRQASIKAGDAGTHNAFVWTLVDFCDVHAMFIGRFSTLQ